MVLSREFRCKRTENLFFENYSNMCCFFAVWNVIVMILLGISILLFIVAFVFAAIYSFYTRRSKYPLVTNCSLIGLGGMTILLRLQVRSKLKLKTSRS